MESVQRHSLNRIRTFIAVSVPADVDTIKFMNALKDIFKEEDIRWVAPGNFHITLRFLGDITGEMLIPIMESLERAYRNVDPFHFFISGIGIFRSISHPRVLWLGLRESQALHDLKSKTDKALINILQIEPQEKYHPHLTIGRMKKINDSNLLEKVLKENVNRDFLKVQVNEIILFRSDLFSEGPVYRILSSYPLC